MLHFALWKQVTIIGFCLLGILLALPNVFYTTADEAALARGEIARIAARGETPSAELIAQAEQWPSFLPGGVLNLGLDLRGGAHLLVEVAVEEVFQQRYEALWPEARDALRDQRDVVGPFRQLEATTEGLVIRLLQPSPAAMDAAADALRGLTSPVNTTLIGGGVPNLFVSTDDDRLIVQWTEAEMTAVRDRTMGQSLEIVRRRVDEAGTREPTIQRQGERRILIQVPGIGSAEELLALLGQTAQLSFHEVIGQTGNPDSSPGPGNEIVPDVDVEGNFYIIERLPTVSGENLVDASAGFDQNGLPAVNFRFDTTGARRFGDYTRQNIGQLFAIVLDDQVISAPRIISAITGGNGQITGNFTVEDANRLAILLRAGALPARIEVLEQRTVGPDLGADSIAAGETATIIALIAVLVLMVASYGLFGIFANIALLLNIGLLIGVLSALGATLTLPGIAGIVLTIGMAVDANVLVFERIREELRRARGVARAIEAGYERAVSAIVDANVTTFIAAAILFAVGSGPVRGFAVTLGIGVITSVFTAVFVTRLIISTWFARARPKALTI